MWSLPQPSTKKIRWTNLEKLEKPDLIQISKVDCNDPAITGYSVYRTQNFESFHAHTQMEDTAFYRSNTSVFGVWQYMPVDNGEAVVEIWKHHDPLIGTCLMVIICLTSRYS